MFKANRKATFADAVAAWQAAGHAGELTNTLYYHLKGKLGLTRKRRTQGRRAGADAGGFAKTAAATDAGDDRAGTYLRIEQKLDALVGQTEQLGEAKLAASLRTARRLASAKLV